MTEVVIGQQEHGYLKGHQLLSASLKLVREDQDLVDRISDISGQLRPREHFAPYLTVYPLPSRRFYVVARTWQDVEAPRAGCVLTRSLFVPMEEWSRLPDIQPIVDLLIPVQRGEKAAPVSWTPGQPGRPPPVVAPWTVELTEALFLEAREPAVVFDTTAAELALLRILTALWPGLRARFAACSHALGPRKVEGREFDLLFAPKSARMRFADWRGRRIEAAGAAPRHRWSEATAKRIFESPDPRLAAIDDMGLLRTHTEDDDGNLRLVLLWNELIAKAKTSPTAVLGLLDIANSQGGRGLATLAPLAMNALEVSRRDLPAADAWRFLVTLVKKFSDDPPPSVADAMRGAARSLARDDPDEAFRSLTAESDIPRATQQYFLPAIADGVAAAPTVLGAWDAFAGIADDLSLELLASKPELAGRLIGTGDTDDHWIETLARPLRAHQHPAFTLAADNLIPALDRPSLVPILDAILVDCDAKLLGNVAERLGRSTDFRIEAFEPVLLRAVRTAEHRQTLRQAVARSSTSSRADHILINTLTPDRESVAWLGSDALPPDRALSLLLDLLGRQSDHTLSVLAGDTASHAILLRLLAADLTKSADALGRLLLVRSVPTADLLWMFDSIRDRVGLSRRASMVRLVLERVLAEGVDAPGRLPDLLAEAATIVPSEELIRLALPPGRSAVRWGINLASLNVAPPQVRSGLLRQVDLLTARLIAGPPDSLGVSAYDAWADLIRDARSVQAAAYERAAIHALDFALSHPRLPVGVLAATTFPPVHERLPKSRSAANDTIWSLMLAVPLAMFGEIDRAKSLRRALVYAFMHSDWPPARLLAAGLVGGVDQKLLKLVKREYRGDVYLSAIAHDIPNLPSSLRARATKALDKFAASDLSRIGD